MNFIITNELWVRLSVFLSVLVMMFILELIIPKRSLIISKYQRWTNNLLLVLLNGIVLRLLFPAAAIGVAFWATEKQWGLFNYYPIPIFWSILFSVIILDLVIYLQHVMFHALPLLWRIHRVHHVDMDIDVTTGLRFHTFEIILSMLIKFSAIILIGVPAIGVIIFEVILNASSMFNHSNINLPFKLDQYLRLFLVTPDMHRVHHSTIYEETNRNFGFSLSIWDKFFGTYKAQPQKGHDKMDIGLEDFKNKKITQKLYLMLLIPFRNR